MENINYLNYYHTFNHIEDKFDFKYVLKIFKI